MKMTFDIGFKDSSIDAKITKAQQTKYFFGREVGDHAVMQLELTADGETYETSVPVMIQEGCVWEFHKGESRTVTEEDQKIHWGELLTKFPAYNGDRELSETAVNAFVAWLRSGNATAKIIAKGVSVDRNSVEHHNCVIVRPLGEKPNDAVPPPPTAKKMPPKPKAKAAKATLNDAWDAYNLGSMIVNDPNGEKFYEAVNNIIGHDYTNATPEEWAKCVAAFKA